MPSWQKILAQGYASAKELLDFLQLPASMACEAAEIQFKTRVPRGFAALMEAGNPCDPLLLQVLSVQEELHEVAGFSHDALQEKFTNPIQGLLHKYHGRVLLILTGACAINCRYCFRRHFPYQENNPGRAGWHKAIEYIRQDTTIQEVIFSGGEPLLAADDLIFDMITQLESIPHLRTIRFHTRMAVVLPERIDAHFIRRLAAVSLQKVMVLHCNHPQELDDRVMHACSKLRAAGCHVLNQSVLLRRINDDAHILKTLSERLFAMGVLPYYLHLVDKVHGAAHFDVPLSESLTIFKTLQTLLPGYLVPRLVREDGGKQHKTSVV